MQGEFTLLAQPGSYTYTECLYVSECLCTTQFLSPEQEEGKLCVMFSKKKKEMAVLATASRAAAFSLFKILRDWNADGCWQK